MMFRQRRVWQTILLLLLAFPAAADPPSTCPGNDEYEKALCAYQLRRFDEAGRAFEAIVERGEPEARTLRATYFLARTKMKVGKFQEAEALLVRIYGMSRAFYETWNGDHLLGECRRAQGK